MRVQVRTTVGGIVARVVLAGVIGATGALVAEHRGWFDSFSIPFAPTVEAPAVPKPPIPSPSPSPVKASRRAEPTTPPGWTNFGGILIPPPGYNDR